MKQKKYIFAIIYFYFCSLSFGQDIHFTIGYEDNGLNLGIIRTDNSICNGIIINGAIVNTDKINGIGVGIFGLVGVSEINGIGVGGLGVDVSEINGIGVGGIGVGGDKINGIGIGGLIVRGDKIVNGIGIGGLGVKADKINGIGIGGTGVEAGKINGIGISLIGNFRIGEQNGLTIGIFNRAEKLRGVQLGLWNIAKNKRFFKHTPIINFSFRRNTEEEQNKIPVDGDKFMIDWDERVGAESDISLVGTYITDIQNATTIVYFDILDESNVLVADDKGVTSTKYIVSEQILMFVHNGYRVSFKINDNGLSLIRNYGNELYYDNELVIYKKIKK